jgi:hypothetical protein
MNIFEYMADVSAQAIETTVEELQTNTDPVTYAWYKIVDPNGLPHPVYIQCLPDMKFKHQEGYIYIPNEEIALMNHYHKVEYDLISDEFYSIRVPQFNLTARKRQGIKNCVNTVIHVVANAKIGSDFYNWNLTDMNLSGFNFNNIDDIYVAYSLNCREESNLEVGETEHAFPYYLDLWPNHDVTLKDGSQAQWEWYYGGTSIFSGLNSTTIYGETADVKNCRYYQGTDCELPNGYAADGREFKQNSSSFTAVFDCGSSTTPDLASVAGFAGDITVQCSGTALSPTFFDNMLPDFEYKIKIDSADTFTFVAGSYFKLQGGANYVADGSKDDFLVIKTNSNNTKAVQTGGVLH